MIDVFISYAHLDDRPVAEGLQGWISQLHQTLGVKLAQLLGEEPSIWRDPKLSGNDVFDETIAKRLPEAATLLSVLTPRYAKSEWCTREVLEFCRAAQAGGGTRLGDKSRLFKIVKTPVGPEELPPELAQVFGSLLGFEFFERDPASGRVREFEEAFGEQARQRYYERVYDLAFDICELIKHYRGSPGADPPAGAGGAGPGGPRREGKTVYLAPATSDLQPDLDALRRELVEQGHRVVPDVPLPLQVEALEGVVKSLLADADLIVQLVGRNYGVVPENARVSVAELQNGWAGAHASLTRTDRLVWTPRDLQVEDERQLAFLQQLRETDAAEPTTEVVAMGLSQLKDLVLERLAPPPEPAPGEGAAGPAAADAAAGREGPPRVYLICGPGDESAVEPLEDFLFEAGLEVILPAFEAEPEAWVAHHREALVDCDAAVVFFGDSPRSWVEVKLRDLLKANGYGRVAPLLGQAVYIAPPLDRRKERFRSHSAAVIRQPDGAFAATPELESFVRSVLGR